MKGKKGAKGGVIPTLEQICSDDISSVAKQYWAPYERSLKPFDPNVVKDIYHRELNGSNFSVRRIMLLEFSQYLECFLWPNFKSSEASIEHILSLAALVNEKFRERVPAWEHFLRSPSELPGFFKSAIRNLLGNAEISVREQTVLLVFLIHCFNSIEVDVIRIQVQKLIGLPSWVSLNPKRREELFAENVKLKKFWNALKKKDAQMSPEQMKEAEFDRTYLVKLIERFFGILQLAVDEHGVCDKASVRYCERFLELIVDLESLLPTRRFFNVILDDCHFVTRCSLAVLPKLPDGHLFSQLLDMVKYYCTFEINDLTGEPLSESDMTDLHYKNITSLQKAAFKNFQEELKEFYLLNVASVDTRKALTKYFSSLSRDNLYRVAEFLSLVPTLESHQTPPERFSNELLLELLVARHERRQSQLEIINESPLYPTEDVIWDENVVPNEYYSGEDCLALNKLNLQFLTLHDYLMRNFSLFRLESTYQIRQDIEDVIFRMKPWRHEEEGRTVFGGWARMAMPINTFSIVEVSKPNIGERSPAMVRADVAVVLSVRDEIKREWENLRRHDVCFLITVRGKCPIGTRFDPKVPFRDQAEIAYVRGCEVEGMLGPDGRLIDEFSFEPKPRLFGQNRTYRVFLDPNQYRVDMESNVKKGSEDVYDTFNIIMRRKPKENNFKAVLETIRQLMNTSCVVPDWLHDIILGYGDPGAAHYSKMPNMIQSLDFNDTFLSLDHLKGSFPDYEVIAKTDNLCPPFKLTFSDLNPEKGEKKTILVEPHLILSRGPYPYNQPKRNAVEFTPTQVEAIKSGMQPGLTMVVGPPGTGKTDVAVQIISNIYHNFPEQRTLIVTHSNQALNQLFEKIIALDVDERHLLRLGHGEEALETESDYSRYGRVNYVLSKRLELLKEVERFQQSLGVAGDVAYTCETAGHFFLYQVFARWEEYQHKIKPKSGRCPVEDISMYFPFHKFFETAPQPLFKGESYEEDWDVMEGCWRYIRSVFQQLDEFRAFELLRSGRDRTEYLLIKEAKIIAMTCTHAALRRKDLVELDFKFDNILMEEAAQILEIETFIPLLLQNPQDGYNRLKRWIMIGDHHQLPPVIKNMAFQKYCNMEQSLFTRFVRLGVPTVQLDAQGRARPNIASLYNWRYQNLGNLPHVSKRNDYQLANAGFTYDYQLINVEDFNGVGESTPSPYFYQNLAEAEYAVAIFTYMRLIGYPAAKITILTTYNGQKHLLRDVINQRCAENPLLGTPHKITTVDKYQGQQNDYVILSLVRTLTVGHLRDVRRLVVAMSRARLGLFVLARVNLFRNCFELTPAFNILCQRPQQLMLYPNERYPGQRKLSDPPSMEPIEIEGMPHMAQFVYELYSERVEELKVEVAKKKEWEAANPPYPEGGEIVERSVEMEEVPEVPLEKDIEFELLEEPVAQKSAGKDVGKKDA